MEFTQKNRHAAFETSLGEDVFVLNQFFGNEALGRLFEYRLSLVSTDPDIKLESVIGTRASARLEMDGGKVRHFNGFVTDLNCSGFADGYAHYEAVMAPWLWFLTQTSDCRIFQEMTVPEILEAIFQKHGFNDYEFRFSEMHPKWVNCVQYNESDFNFISRLMETEGIYYFFEHTKETHKIILADYPEAHQPCPGAEEVTYRQNDDQGMESDMIYRFRVSKRVCPGAMVVNDFDFENPGDDLEKRKDNPRPSGQSGFELYRYPGTYKETDYGESLARLRLEEAQVDYERVQGEGTARGLLLGHLFKLTNFPRQDQNREYLITGINFKIDAGGLNRGAPGEGFTCSFVAIPSDQVFRSPSSTPKPVIRGPQTAVVAGPSGEEIFTDEYGRVKVLFPWDRYGKGDENSSCWIRVSHGSAGSGYGIVVLPRIGQEVIVEFLEGDPDRPIITGRVYNGENRHPYELPGEMTVSTMKSNSSKGGGGFNEIRFEDKAGSEEIYVHAEKEMNVRVKSTHRENVGGERHLNVDLDKFENVEKNRHEVIGENHHEEIKGDRHVTVCGDEAVDIGGNQSFTVGGNVGEQYGGNHHEDTGGAIFFKAGQKIVLEAASNITFKVGGSSIAISPAGITIDTSGMMKINSGTIMDINASAMMQLKAPMIMIN